MFIWDFHAVNVMYVCIPEQEKLVLPHHFVEIGTPPCGSSTIAKITSPEQDSVVLAGLLKDFLVKN